ncbi:MAG: dipeptide epimerase [Fimbriimonadaceae bacterium]|nr:dipeptide epimerase [Fimbriimonadaceae bacterium]
MATERIARVDVLPTSLPVKPQEDASRGLAQQHVFLRLETTGGVVGWGEARALPSWTGESVEAIDAALRNHYLPVLLGINPFARNSALAALDEIITGGVPSARAAVDMALYDLQGQLAGLPVHELLGGKRRDKLQLSQSLRADSPGAMREAARRMHDAHCLKVKLTGDPGLDAERLVAVTEGAPHVEIWLDANQSYTPTRALGLLDRIRSVRRVACLQQPVAGDDWFGLARLRERSPIPIAVDEGCLNATDVLRLAQLGACDLVVLKLCKAGGLLELVRAAETARLCGLDVLGSGLTESGVGLTAALHVYSTLNLRLPPQLNGPQFLHRLCVDGLEWSAGDLRVPSAPGLGVRVDEELIRSLALDL